MSTQPVPAGPDLAPALVFSSAPGRWVLIATVLGSGLAAIDATAVGVALPSIGRDFGTGLASLQWVVTAYTLTLAGLLLVGGSLGDRYGRRKVFVIGVVWFATASLLCGLAPNASMLIGARALQGVGAALLTPGSLAILQSSFGAQDRSRAIGAWSGLSGVATAVGPFLGGWLVAAVSWRLIFFLNLPLAVAVILIAARHVPESTDPAAPRRIDLRGAALGTLGLVGLCYGLIEGPSRGWTSGPVIVPLVAGAALLVAFVTAERRTHEPMLPPSLFASRQFAAANLVTFVVYAGLGGALFLLPIELQEVGGYSPVEAGTALLPITIIMLTLSARSGALAARIGPRLQMSVGPLVAGGGLALLSRAGHGDGYWRDVLPAVIVLGLGLATTVAPLTSTALAAAPVEKAGVASAVNNDVARTAQLLAVAVLPAVAGLSGASYLQAGAFDHGFRIAMLLAAAIAAVGGLTAAASIRNRPDQRAARRRHLRPAHFTHCALDATPVATTADNCPLGAAGRQPRYSATTPR
ncbi:DHA2 family efflux MFS transporter permease subunit [Pseudofrankia inefficax]|uniref:Drug resistance transporter, EmrB/QacA subfamily n=1 Tax=Pseudofrankia inefficax (strain DSM 45817 / CECT 9037 / DDB 130130 / EuI1c) TaxID=298654 RepID=E3IW47_PSEI1|nr:DHA2 family efflux MFS transporter permease subunit [Pseudofrankia inefficax]ADP84975.1 drug resistance transporter, EmrB/QacA subfamily [Pseudofrankia inefficax]